MQRAQGSVDWLERRDVFLLSTENIIAQTKRSVRLLFKREFGSAGSWMSGEAVESKPISFVGAKCGGGDDPKQAKPKREC